jgi:predicted transcriptional regulator
MDLLLSGRAKRGDPVGGVMKKPFPVLKASAPYTDALRVITTRGQAVLVEDGGEVVGILTKHDLVEHMLAGRG